LYGNLTDLLQLQPLAGAAVDGLCWVNLQELIINGSIHPLELDRRGLIKELTESLQEICQAMAGQPVVYQFSDLLTDQLYRLQGGKELEHPDTNPLLGYRGAYRVSQQPDMFEIEMEAVKQVRHARGLRNLSVALPAVRSAKELLAMKRLLATNGLVRSHSFTVWLMVDAPVQIIDLEAYVKAGIDGWVLDLYAVCQLMVAADLSSERLETDYLADSEVTGWIIGQLAAANKSFKLPKVLLLRSRDWPDSVVRHAVKHGYEGICVSVAQVNATRELVAESEKELVKKHFLTYG
jgi:pyruvate,water dikinase